MAESSPSLEELSVGKMCTGAVPKPIVQNLKSPLSKKCASPVLIEGVKGRAAIMGMRRGPRVGMRALVRYHQGGWVP